MMAGHFIIARHGETVFNAAARMQGASLHTPLTRRGFAQAEAMGAALRERLGAGPPVDLWSSPAGRALQTMAVIVEHLDLGWEAVRTDPRLSEIAVGEWSGRLYREVAGSSPGPIDPGSGLFRERPPGGEWYDEVAERLRSWLDEREAGQAIQLVVMHGMASRILRGLLTGAPLDPRCNAPVAAALPQGSIAEVVNGRESPLLLAASPLA